MSIIFVGYFLIYLIVLPIALYVTTTFYPSKRAKRIVLAAWLLIPTWDVILGYPIYLMLCWTSAGAHIYKTVDNVEGFYIGEKSRQFEPYEPYTGYRYVEYKEEETGKYYRSYWMDSNTSELCVAVGDDGWMSNGVLYSESVKQGHCIAKEEISKSEVSQWAENFARETIYEIPILKFEIYRISLFKNRKSGEIIAEAKGVWWQGGVFGRFSSVGPGGMSCNGDLNLVDFQQNVLKSKH